MLLRFLVVTGLGVLLIAALFSAGDGRKHELVYRAYDHAWTCRGKVDAFLFTHKEWPRSAREAGCEATSTHGILKVVPGRIEVTLYRVNKRLDGGKLFLTIGPGGAWECSTSVEKDLHRHLPNACQRPRAK